jgi:hypothetical protein
MNQLIQFQKATLVFIVALTCFGLSPKAQAVSPAPDGLYPGANVAEGGGGALFSLTTGTNNTALGSEALFSITTGKQNTATGAQALKNNTGDFNTATGFQALTKNSSGITNTATGWRALFNNSSGFDNTAVGFGALYWNNTTAENTAIGSLALGNSHDGFGNTAVGSGALGTLGIAGHTGGRHNIALGLGAGAFLNEGDENIYLGSLGPSNLVASDEFATIRIGDPEIHAATFIAGIFGQTASEGTAVFIDTNGRLGTATSSRRFKEEIRPMEQASEGLFALKPVTFHYKNDTKGTSQFGLIAEEVEKVNPDLVVRDKGGKPYTIRYDAVNAMLLNEFLKEHQMIQELKKQVAELTAGLQKVSAQVELSQTSPQTVSSPAIALREGGNEQ